jgi:predicted N-formylglutamate amidohydrolase
LLTCEHAGNRVPAAYRALFAGVAARGALATHRGYDIGAYDVARALARRLHLPLHAPPDTRLLAAPNRPLGHPPLGSTYSSVLSRAAREAVLAPNYVPHRAKVERALRERLERHAVVVQVAVHSFTPRLHGHIRRADIGLVYDPARRREAALCAHWQAGLRAAVPQLVVRRNYPYRGTADGLTTSLRRELGSRYLGIEIELNQGRLADRRFGLHLAAALATTLQAATAHG